MITEFRRGALANLSVAASVAAYGRIMSFVCQPLESLPGKSQRYDQPDA